jgi:enoyl-CoA hydratase/carnithine racemase
VTVRDDVRDGVLWLTLDRPDRLNAFTPESYRQLELAIRRAAADSEIRAVVLTGKGRAFSAGADRSLVDGSASEAELALAGEAFEGMLQAFAACDTPVVAAVNGLGVGLGCTILLHCDLVLMAESARLRLPFTAMGIVPEAGSSVLLPARARWGDAAWAMLSSEWLDAPTALAMGLAWRVVPDEDLIGETERVTATIAALDSAAVAATKRLLTTGRDELLRAAMEREARAMQALRSTTD